MSSMSSYSKPLGILMKILTKLGFNNIFQYVIVVTTRLLNVIMVEFVKKVTFQEVIFLFCLILISCLFTFPLGHTCLCQAGFSGNQCQNIGIACYPGACGAGQCVSTISGKYNQKFVFNEFLLQ